MLLLDKGGITMTKVVIIVKNGLIEQVYCRNKNIEVEILDMDTQDLDTCKEREQRLKQIKKANSYKELL